jgi:hypothetical protein
MACQATPAAPPRPPPAPFAPPPRAPAAPHTPPVTPLSPPRRRRALLSDGRTRVAGEATVFYTADAWLHARRGGNAAQQAALAACVRVQWVPLEYLTAVVAQSPWFTKHVTAAELHQAVAYRLAAARIAELACSAVDTPAPRHAAWQLPPRPASGVRKLRMEWDVPLATLKRLHKAAARQGPGGTAEAACPRTWAHRGMGWTLEVMAEADRDGAIAFGLFVTPAAPLSQPESSPAAAAVSASITLDARSSRRKLRCGCRVTLLLGCEGRGFDDMFELGPRRVWDEAAWRLAGLVGDDNCVRVIATVKDVA